MRCAAHDRPEFRGDACFDLDGLWKSDAKHFRGFLDQIPGLDRCAFFFDAFGNGKKLRDKVSRVFSILPQGPHPALTVTIQPLPLKLLQRDKHQRKYIIEIMSNSAGHSAQVAHALYTEELRLQSLSFRNVRIDYQD